MAGNARSTRPTTEQEIPPVAWLCGGAPAFDEAVLGWLAEHEVVTLPVEAVRRPAWRVPVLTRLLRFRAYLRRLAGAKVLVLPYLAGDSVMLARARGPRKLGVALGSDLLRRHRASRLERALEHSLPQFDGLWAVSAALSSELRVLGRAADWTAPVGVDLRRLPPVGGRNREQGRIFSARNDAPHYRRSWVRFAASVSGAYLVEANSWPPERMLQEYAQAEIVASLPSTDGAPATIMEALCCGAHVVASGGPTVRTWLEQFGGTHGEPETVGDACELIALGMNRARTEAPAQRSERATRARRAFDRDTTLAPLLAWLRAREQQSCSVL